MADNWWDSSSRTRPCLDSVSSVSVTSINLFQDTDATNTTTTTGGGSGTSGGVLGADPSLQMMGLGLSSQPGPQSSLDWNQALFRGDPKNDQSGYRNLLQEDQSLSSNTSTFQLENNQWRPHKMYSATSQDSSSDFKQINIRGFQLDQPVQYGDNNSIITCEGLNSSFQNMDSYGSPSTIIQSLFGSDNSNQQQEQDSGFDQNRGLSYGSSYQSSYGSMSVSGGGSGELLHPNWSKYPPPAPQEFSVNSPPKVQPPNIGSQLHFSNNARFWNAPAAAMNDIRSSFFPSLQMQLPTPTQEDKPKITSEVVKKSSSESSSTKRPRNENQSPLPAFKVRKEKMGDRITALQQLVSPFGKTDTASVLSEAIEYIKFLHEQVSVLSTPYMKNGAPIMQQQHTGDQSSEGLRQDLRSRGLCLVPVSSTFPVTHETTVDFWTPTFGGTYR